MPPPVNLARTPQVARWLAQAARLLRAGRPADAIGPLRLAVQSAPNDAAILHDLGLALLECGHAEEAIAALTASIAVHPRFADTHLRLGIALEMAGSVDAALAAYRRAAELLPSLADARYRAGDLLESLGRQEEAAQSFRRAAASDPKSTLGRIAAAKALLATGRDGEAEKILRQALAVEKTNAVAHELLGNLLADAGRFDEARAAFARAIACSPLRAGCYYDLVRCRKIGADDGALISQMREAASLPGLEPAQRSRVELALGKAAHDLGDFEAAMRHFDAAEALRNSVLHFDADQFAARMGRMTARFTPETMARGAGRTRTGPTPILILGLPRSGTTLVEQILSAHPGVCAGGELGFWNERGAIWEKIFGQAGGGAAEEVFFGGAAADYADRLRGIGPGAACVTDKMPLNFQWAGLVHCAVPDAVIIHCRRNPADTALSIHQTHFNPRMPFPTGGAALVRYIRGYQVLAEHWRRVLPPDRFIGIEYEHLVSEPEAVIRPLLAACGLDWDEACLRPDQVARAIRTPSKWQVRQPISRNAIGSWRVYEPWLGPLRVLAD